MKFVFAERQGIALADRELTLRKVFPEKVFHHDEGLSRSDDRRIGIGPQECVNVGGVVGLHMLDDKVIGFSAVQGGRDIVQPLVCEIAVDRVHHGGLFIQKDIGVVGHAFRDMIVSFEQVDLVIVDAYIADIVGKLHGDLLCFRVIFSSNYSIQEANVFVCDECNMESVPFMWY